MAKDQPGKRGAKPVKPAAPALEVIGEALTAHRQGVAVMTEQQQQVLAKFGDGLPYVRDLYIAENRLDVRHAAEAAVRVGRRLLVMKEHESHGEWLNCLTAIGIDARTAQRMMEAARRLAALPNAATVAALTDAAGGQAKMFELLSLPEDQFSELATDGSTQGLELDDVEGMTVRELREAVREARADRDARAERNAKLSEAVERAEEKASKAQRRWKSAKPDERLAMLQQCVTEAELEITAALRGNGKTGLLVAVNELANHCIENDLDSSEFLGDVFRRLLLTVRLVRDHEDYGIAIPVVGDGD